MDAHGRRSVAGDEQHDARFHEAAALDEIELFSELIIATGDRAGPLSVVELDRLLGLTA